MSELTKEQVAGMDSVGKDGFHKTCKKRYIAHISDIENTYWTGHCDFHDSSWVVKEASMGYEDDFPRVAPEGTKPIVKVFFTVEPENSMYVARLWDIQGAPLDTTLRNTVITGANRGFAEHKFAKFARLIYPKCAVFFVEELPEF